jgi:hypothetical protein
VLSAAARRFGNVDQPAGLSADLRAAAEAERAVVDERVCQLREQARRLRELADQVDVELGGNIRLLRQIDELLGHAPQMSIAEVDEDLRGQRLREVAIQVLKRRKGAGTSVHYREWYALLVAEGHTVSGKDPVATFLTQVSRSDEVERVGRRSGVYRLLAA